MWRGEIRLTWRLLLKKKVSAEETFFFFSLLPVKNDVSHTENKLDGVA